MEEKSADGSPAGYGSLDSNKGGHDEGGHNEGEKKKLTCFEDLLDEIGAFGYWQRVIFVLISLADVHGALAMLIPVFIGATPKWSCTQLEDGSNKTSTNETWAEACKVDGIKCEEFSFHDEFTSIVSQWDLVCDKDYVSDLITTIQMAGLLIGAGIFGQLSDLIGRKKTYFIVYTIMCVFALVSSFVESWQLYAASRAIVGFGFGGLMVVACVYPIEFVGRRWRVFCGTIGFWALGTMILAPMGYWLRDWRHLNILASASGFYFYIMWFFIPESPRWLIQQQRFEEAEVILTNIARKNGKPPPDISDLKKIEELDKAKTEKVKKYTYWDILSVKKYCKRTVVMFLSWFIVFLMYYELSYNLKNLSGDRYLNMFLSGLVDLFAMLSVIFVLTWMGRRKGLIFYLLIAITTLMSILFIIVAEKDESLSELVTTFALIGKACALSGTYSVQIWTAELFPTVVRNLGVGAGSIAGRIGGIIAPQLVYLGTVSTVAPYIICSALSVIAIPMAFLLPETLNRPLEDKFEPNTSTSKVHADEAANGQTVVQENGHSDSKV